MADKNRPRSAGGGSVTALREDDAAGISRSAPPVAHGNEEPPTAHSLEEAANSDNSLEGYAAMNANDHEEISRIAYRMYEERGGEHGLDQDDWYRAEREYRQRRSLEGPTKV